MKNALAYRATKIEIGSTVSECCFNYSMDPDFVRTRSFAKEQAANFKRNPYQV